MSNKLFIYLPELTERITYIFNFLLSDLLGLQISFTSNLSEFKQSDSFKFFYDFENPIDFSCPYIKCHKILFENYIHPIKPEIFQWKQTPVFFETSKNSLIPFDIFAASFYLISRYEEYLSFKSDRYGRFPAKESLAFQNNFLDKPIIEEWTQFFKQALLKYYPDLKFKTNNFSAIVTFDIDNAFADLHKGIFRTSLSLIKLVISFNFNLLKNKIQVLRKHQQDSYDSYSYIKAMFEKFHLYPVFFILSGKYGKYDKNIPTRSKSFKKLVHSLAKNYEIGIHPSYQSNKKFKILNNEKKHLSYITNKRITKSRQHFLKLQFPTTYRNLIKADILSDYSMGYAEFPGFRAGTSQVFSFFDLLKNKKENLKIIPFSVMDVGLKDYLHLNPEDAICKIEKIIENLKQVDGLFVCLWHNESLGTNPKWENWREVFEKSLKLIHGD